jgi:polysaccharide export outer membrane protein
MPFNLKSVSVQNPGRLDAAINSNMQLYLWIPWIHRFPVLGKLKVGGLSRSSVQMLQQKIGVYVKNPIINLRIMNFKVSVQGVVNSPGTYTVDSKE